MSRIILSEFVVPEIEAIWEYIAIDNSEAADRFVDSVFRTFETLAGMPGLGRSRKIPHARLREVRSFRVKGFENYLIFYGSISDGIEVLHILHGARDIESFWEED
jgi:toxin ParE1/3/4